MQLSLPEWRGIEEVTRRIAFLTKGETPFGRKLCSALAHLGYSIGFTCSKENACDLQKAVESTGKSALAFAVTDFDASTLSEAVVATVEHFGRLDVLVFLTDPPSGASNMLLDLDEGDWDSCMNRGAKGFFLLAKYALPYLIDGETSHVIVLETPRGDARESNATEGASDGALAAVLSGISEELASCGIKLTYRNHREIAEAEFDPTTLLERILLVTSRE